MRLLTSALMLLLAPMSAMAVTVASFDVGSSGGFPLNTNEVAGVVAVSNWNVLSGAGFSDTFTDGIDSTGANSGIDIAINGADSVRYALNTFHGLTGSDSRMMSDIAYDNGTGDSFTVSFSDIGYSSYDVYLYTGAKWDAWGGNISDGTTTYYVRGNDPASTYTQGTETGSFAAATSADYVKFSGLTGATQDFTFTVDETQIFFAGAQIVSLDGASGPSGPASSISAVPEPSSAFILAVIGCTGVLRRRRRK